VSRERRTESSLSRAESRGHQEGNSLGHGPSVCIRRALGVLTVVLLCGGCPTYTERAVGVYQAVDAGDYHAGILRLNRILDAPTCELPDRWTAARSLAVLERAVLLQATGQYECSARTLTAAETQLEVLDLATDPVGTLGRYIYSDTARIYRTPPAERLALSSLNQLNYLARNDLNGAGVEARRFTVSRTYLEALDQTRPAAFGSYLAGFVFERLGEPDRALRYYEEALDAGDLHSLREPIERLSQRADYRGPRLRAYLDRIPVPSAGPLDGRPPAPEAEGEILLVLGLGRVPLRVPQRIPIGAALSMAGVHVAGDTELLSRLVLKVLVYPELAWRDNLVSSASVRLGGQELPVELLTNLGSEIAREYEAMKPLIVASALTRMIARAAAAEAARQSLRKSGESTRTLAALAAEAALLALDRPDTRSWTLLPAHLYICRTRVPPGRHDLHVTLQGRIQETRVIPVDVPPGGFRVVAVIEPR